MSKSKTGRIEARTVRLSLLDSSNLVVVADGYRRCVQRLPNGYWLKPGSAYNLDAPSQLAKNRGTDLTAGLDDLADYVAISGLLHQTDAWSYLGRAVSALAAGVPSEAMHLAYYSELRSALSILACQGIVVANHSQYVLASGGAVVQLSVSGTHEAAWDCLSDWASTAAGAGVVGSIVRHQGRTLTAWLQGRQFAGGSTSVVGSLMQSWGLDLATYRGDRKRRNLASYLPSDLEFARTPETPESVRALVGELCLLLEPSTPGAFPTLDAKLVALALRGAFKGRDLSLTGEALRSIASRVLPPGRDSERAGDDLLFHIADNSSLPHNASISGPAVHPPRLADIRAVFGRALILARLSTGAVSLLQESAGVILEDMGRWADFVGVKSGYWDPPPRPDPLLDLWEDLRADVESLQAEHPFGPARFFTLHDNSASTLLRLSGLTRAPLWNLSA